MHQNNLGSIFVYALSCTALLACGSNGSGSAAGTTSDALEGVPEQSAVELSVTDDTPTEDLATSDDAVEPAAFLATGELGQVAQAVTTEPAAALADARTAVAQLNQAIRSFMQPIAALVRNASPTTAAGETEIWGPVVRGMTEVEFVLRHGTLHHYGWVLEARPAGSADAFRTVAAGGITVGFAPRRGTGSLGLDLDALAAVDPTETARGLVLARFAHGARGSNLGYRLVEFVPPATVADASVTAAPIDAVVKDVRITGGVHRLRLAYFGNVPETATSAPELVLARVRHTLGVGGRVDLVASGGDVPDGSLWWVVECWDSGLGSVYRSVRTCPVDGPGGPSCQAVPGTEKGSRDACPAAFANAELPPSNPVEPMADADSPVDDVTPPEAMPDGTAPGDGDAG